MSKIKDKTRIRIIQLHDKGLKAVDIQKKLKESLGVMQIAGIMAHHTRGTYDGSTNHHLTLVI